MYRTNEAKSSDSMSVVTTVRILLVLLIAWLKALGTAEAKRPLTKICRRYMML